MPAPLSVWTRAIIDVLADGAWHDREELLAAAAAVVPPGVAARRAEQDRRERSGAPHRTRGHDQVVAIGARSVARGSLKGLDRSGTVERRRPEHGRVVYRLACR